MSSDSIRAHSELSVAPMMAWTDRHCRSLLRLTSRHTVLFTEMVSAAALIHGPADRLLRHDAREQPLVLQLGGSDADELARAAELAARGGYTKLNLNVGCPSPRVQRGRFGACLMREPELVGSLVSAMRDAAGLPVSVKCRLGVDDHDSQPLLEAFVETVARAGSEKLYVHARKALLNGLSPAQNRQIPPLQYERVHALKARFPELEIILNGGITSLADALVHLDLVDGVMIGRQAYQQPLLMNELAVCLFREPRINAFQVMDGYLAYMTRELQAGTRLADMTRHCLGLFAGLPGARRYRRILSDQRRLRSNDIGVVHEALDQLQSVAA
jgi:tRNA-dihydrouridine synthase A